MQTVIGLFENAHDAQKAAQQLMSDGFTKDNVDVSVRNGDYNSLNSGSSDGYSSENTGAFGGSSTAGSSDNYSENAGAFGGSSTAGSSTMGTSDYTTGSNYGSGTMDNSANVAGSTGSTSGTYERSGDYDRNDNGDSFGDKVSKFFKNLFGNDDDEAGRYSHVANKTGNIVTVHAQSEEEAERAAEILDENGAIDVNESAAGYGYEDRTSNYSSDGNDGESNTLNVIKEDVQVGKREVETGGVRLRSRIVERPVEEVLRLKEEKVRVERNPVDRAATTVDFENFKEGEIEMTERAEVADVSKQARVVEEVKLSKEVNERKETVRETARDTQVDVENLSTNDLTRKTNKKKDY